jgi:hypothetical protein
MHFTSVGQVDIIDHKKDYCKLRFTCKCDYLNIESDDGNGNPENQQSSKAGKNVLKRLKSLLECSIRSKRSKKIGKDRKRSKRSGKDRKKTEKDRKRPKKTEKDRKRPKKTEKDRKDRRSGKDRKKRKDREKTKLDRKKDRKKIGKDRKDRKD